MVIPRLMGRLRPLKFLFAKNWGIVWSMPLVFLGIVGLVIFVARDWRKRWPYLAGFTLSSFITLGKDEGSAYGFRYFIANLSLCFLGLALVFDKFLERKKLWIAVIFVCAAGIWQYLSIIQYRITLWFNNPRYTFEVLPSFLKMVKEGNLDVIIMRPLSWFSMVFKWGFKIHSAKDAFFLLGIPVLFVFFLFLPLVVWYFGLHRKILSYFPGRKKLTGALLIIGFFIATDAVLLLENPPKTEKEIAINYQIVGKRYLAKSKHEKAYNYLIRSRELNPDDVETTRLLAHTLAGQEKLAQSLELFEEIIQKGQGNYSDYLNIASLRLRSGASRESVIQFIQKALELTRNNPELTKKVLLQIKEWGFSLE